MKKKLISILIPTYNEQDNVIPLAKKISELFLNELKDYRYEIVFIDNYSKDATRVNIRRLCNENRCVKAIFNAKNFGWMRSPFYGITQTNGDCTVLMCADFQEPPEMIPKFVKEWEEGYKIVIGIKSESRESKLMYFLRTCYYKTISRMSEVEQIQHFTGFGLYDRSFVEVMKDLEDPLPYIRGIVAELGFTRKELTYEQDLRRSGKSKGSFYALYDTAMLGLTSYTKIGLRLATLGGFVLSVLSLLVAFVYLLIKILFWYSVPTGYAPIMIGVFGLGSVQLFFIGLMGEYVLNINTRVMKRPLVVEEERINFDNEKHADLDKSKTDNV